MQSVESMCGNFSLITMQRVESLHGEAETPLLYRKLNHCGKTVAIVIGRKLMDVTTEHKLRDYAENDGFPY